MKGLRSIVPLSKDSMRGVEPRKPGREPKLQWVRPTDLFVEEAYQRGMESANSTTLVRKIAGGFRWSHFKPPICVHIPEFDALVVIDGQHTATAAASNPHVDQIPVLVVDAADVAERAGAFVGHNRTRLGLTQIAIYKAELAAGDPIARSVARAAEGAGARIVYAVAETRPDRVKPGMTFATGTLKSLVKNRGEDAARRSLWILTQAGRAPIVADEIAAIALAIEGTGEATDAKFVPVVAKHSAQRWKATATSATADTNVALPVALATLWREEIGLGRPIRQMKSAGKSSALDAVKVARPAAALKPEPEPEPSFIPPIPDIPPVPTIPPMAPLSFEQPKPAAAPARAGRVVTSGGISIDLDAGTVARDKRALRLPLDQAAFAGALLRVMPALLPADRVASKVWGGPVGSPKAKLAALAEEANIGLAAVRLKIREHQGSFAISAL